MPYVSLIAIISSYFINKPLSMSGKGEDRRVLKVCPVKLQSTMTAQTTMLSLFMLAHRISVLMFSFDFSQIFHPGLDLLAIKMEK